MTAIALVFALAASPVGAAPSPQTAALQATLERFNAHAVYPLPPLAPAQLRALDAGEVVRILDRLGGDGRRRAVALLVTRAEPAELWVACQDPHFTADPDLTEVRLSLDPDTGRARWYGHVDLPAPFKDRHWLLDVWNNHALAAASDGALWEHAWQLDAGRTGEVAGRVAAGEVGGLTLAAFEDSIETPVNHGAWITMDLPQDRALVGYHVTTVVGGSVPEGLFTRFVLMGMERMMRGVEQRAVTRVRTHYVAGHEPLPAGGPSLLPPFE